jgi:hypothetical protein
MKNLGKFACRTNNCPTLSPQLLCEEHRPKHDDEPRIPLQFRLLSAAAMAGKKLEQLS